MNPAEKHIRQLNDLLGPAASPNHLQSDPDHLRIRLQYLMLDLEATRRENQMLLELLRRLQEGT